MKRTYRHTMFACYGGYVVQAIVNNFAPLLFLTFQNQFAIPIDQITFLVTFNFGLQLLVDLLSAGIIDRIGYRASAVIAHILSAAGLIGMAILPEMLSNPFTGLMAAVVLYAIGGGMIEVLITPLANACPSDDHHASVSLLHSFYCWGHMAVVLLSTIFFFCLGTARWQILALIWSIIPLANAVFFTRVPIPRIIPEGETGLPVKELLRSSLFWLMVVLMLCAGASEQAVSQWASTFAEQGLGVSKTVGDLTGPMLFAAAMGASRLLYSRCSRRLDIRHAILFCSALCIGSYLLISLSPWPVLGLAGCGLCGFSVGIFWPGTTSLSAERIPRGGTVMFALLALAGDLGCSVGPTVVGMAADRSSGGLHTGILSAIGFPAVLLVGILLAGRSVRKPSSIAHK